MSEEKSVGIGVRIPEAVKIELENAAWAEGTTLTQLVMEGIALVLEPIRAKHKGNIPEKPKRPTVTWTKTETEPEKPAKRNKK
jgi:hypothetical protein